MRVRVGPFARVVALLAGVACLASALAAAQSPVGFRVVERRDASRPLPGAAEGRPIQIAVWYPAIAWPGSEAGQHMVYRDYMVLALSEKSFAKPSSEAVKQMVSGYRKFLESTGVAAADADAILAARLAAIRNAPAARGTFPLILLAPGNGQSADDVAAMAERLAARGFLAASTPSPTRISGPMQSEADIPVKAEEQAADLAFAREALRQESRSGAFGVAGHSFGARSALLLAMRDSGVSGVVSMDGGIGSKTGAGMLEKARGFSHERMTAPLLHFYEELDPQMAPDFGLLRSLDRSNRWLIRVSSMHHVHFTTLGAVIAASPALARATSATRETAEAFEAVAQAAISFLDWSVNGNGAGSDWRVPPASVFRVEQLAASR